MQLQRSHTLAGGHGVGGQGTGLVRTDHIDRAEYLDAGQPPHQRLLPCHALHADGQGDGDNRRQPLGNGRHGDTDSRLHHVVQRQSSQQVADHNGQHGNNQRQDAELASEARQLLLQWGIHQGGLTGQLADAADFGLGGSTAHQTAAHPGGHQRAHKSHAVLLGQRRSGRRRRQVLAHRYRFSGQHGFVAGQILQLQQTQVRRHLVARLQADQITRYQLAAVDGPQLAVAPDQRAGAGHTENGLQGGGCLALLHKTHQRVDQHHAEDHPGVDPMAHQQTDHATDQQHIDQRVLKLAGKAPPGRFRRCWRQGVGTVLLQPRLRLGLTQPLIGAVQTLKRAGRVNGVPVNRRSLLGHAAAPLRMPDTGPGSGSWLQSDAHPTAAWPAHPALPARRVPAPPSGCFQSG